MIEIERYGMHDNTYYIRDKGKGGLGLKIIDGMDEVKKW